MTRVTFHIRGAEALVRNTKFNTELVNLEPSKAKSSELEVMTERSRLFLWDMLTAYLKETQEHVKKKRQTKNLLKGNKNSLKFKGGGEMKELEAPW